MKVLMTICTLSTLAALAGCAGASADVRASGDLSATDAAAATYRLARTPAQDDAGEPLPYEPLLRAGLAQRGFKEGSPEAAHYLVSAAWASRPADVAVSTASCTGGCVPSEGPSFPWFGTRYVHTLTLRFFALPDGHEAYKVSAEKRDRDADAQKALPYLVAGALARLPYAGAPQWRVKLKEAAPAANQTGTQAGAPAMPDVISVTPLAQ
ncbi:DUF4136 domain-containing protein [Paraburkholderia tagetis]|uniref:DUF4136 domain-containing protein n=1 Tax=Paraburkholderia tagetis TaxID=2913261 RepID=A0A9X1RLE6_9BURK|nr:DUF4136 domain-containing protein [Paraburkholderia tagetis]MCG5073275.1 DUF4136 domain-containing protein [Paraburkholderia tagetis]